jgi:pilus assembly protein Flp/PilA
MRVKTTLNTMIGNRLRRFWPAREAVTAIEYALIASLIAVAIIVALSTLGNSISSTFNYVATSL